MPSIRRTALESLARCIEGEIQQLKGKVVIQDTDAQRSAGSFDSLARDLPDLRLDLDPGRLRYQPEQAREYYIPSPSQVVMDVGRHEGTVMLKLVAADTNQREELEQQLLDLWLGQELRPGVLVTPVSAIQQLGTFYCAWELEGDSWRDELVFERPKMSIMEITALVPALVTRNNVHEIEQLQLATTEDFDAVLDETVVTSANVEVVDIAEDGTITPVT